MFTYSPPSPAPSASLVPLLLLVAAIGITLRFEVLDDMKLGKIVKQAGFRSGIGIAQEAVSVRWHAGLGNYTVGQRTGLRIATGTPLYVIGLDRANNRVVVGTDEELLKSHLLVREINWVRPARVGDSFEARVKIRNKHFPAAARVEVRADGEADVEFARPQRAITPGQAAVFYDGNEMVGGGWISGVID